MTREDAYYYKNLLMLGFFDEYDDWLNSCLELEDPLSDIVLELSCCSADVKKAISLLHNYCLEQPLDESVVCDRFRVFFKEAYYSNRMSKDEITSTMYRLALNIGDPGDFDINIWGTMYYLDDYHSLAKDGILFWESFDFAFFSYLDNGTPLDSNLIWSKNIKKKQSLFNRIKSVFKKITQNNH